MAKAQKVVKQKHNMNSPEQLEAIKAAIIAGETPRSIHEKYGTSIVNIHYHKAQLRKQGLLGDAKKTAAKSTTDKKTTVSPKSTAKTAKAAKAETPKAKAVKVKATPAAPTPKVAEEKKAKAVTVPAGNGPLSFVIGGTKVSIDKSAKSVKVGKKSVEIEF